MKKILVVIGTRPEAIKMAPLIKGFQSKPDVFNLHVCVTAQHRQMLDQVMDFFDLVADSDLDLMKPDQSLSSLSSKLLDGVSNIITGFNPDYVFVHGDTSTAMIAALASFYAQKKIVHIEAGLRTHNIYSPFPEEANRQIISRLASLHMAPTARSKQELLNEKIDEQTIAVTGNTVIDALFLGLKIVEESPSQRLLDFKNSIGDSKVILVTSHRRENQGTGILEICKALRIIAREFPNYNIIFPVHLNPNILNPVSKELEGIHNIILLEPLDYELFIWIMKRSYLIITDSGGIQEEAPSLNKPVIVMREFTERQEAVDSGAVILVGNNKELIVSETRKLILDKSHYDHMASAVNPYGDGKAVPQIIKIISNEQV
ncbi:UDP-N-acetylglucosamine 2-epimerase (non-hydrolysing) [Nonlabens dokdonensis]|uniref:UDP-N-acetylglucosamine 2-epimerase (non-hydrolyzing) n=2 Tax=Nonlabens dokdonensis TaxID=328515 RepID=L7WEW1_NONDD|nr:UDP-N-acetylglucosamine 2-epimerase (non-hydrolyzing) [Nonlabens dokdonensis]AGC77413.1 UDP-N-acetylglucosamine 2-epimerase [Nonlabens dokdonensis DSW-6]PZX40939.1 UDP-N-acetylglucosamine 2-epimerase (non-hydrolysing) [Nonlabens dokdonensis]